MDFIHYETFKLRLLCHSLLPIGKKSHPFMWHKGQSQLVPCLIDQPHLFTYIQSFCSFFWEFGMTNKTHSIPSAWNFFPFIFIRSLESAKCFSTPLTLLPQHPAYLSVLTPLCVINNYLSHHMLYVPLTMGLVRLKKSNSYCISIFAPSTSSSILQRLKVSQMNNRDGGGKFDSQW